MACMVARHVLFVAVLALSWPRATAQFGDLGAEGMDEGMDGMFGGLGNEGMPNFGGEDSPARTSSGVIELDHITFDKIINPYHPYAVLVRFDKSYSYGPENDAYVSLGPKSEGAGLLVATVAASEWEESDPKLAIFSKFGIAIADCPQYVLFPANEPTKHVTYKGDKANAVEIIQFLEHNKVHMVLYGCLREFDQLVVEFSEAAGKWTQTAAKEVITKAEHRAAELKVSDRAKAQVYIQIMKKRLEKGAGFITSEIKRVQKLKGDKSIKPEKRDMFVKRLNVLASFPGSSEALDTEKDVDAHDEV